MLAGAFFITVFSSILWAIYAFTHAGAGITDFTITVAVVCLPIGLLWSMFGYAYQYISAGTLNKNMYSLFKQMRKNQDYSDLIAKVILEAEQELRDSLVLSKFDLLIADMNELLSDILLRGSFISAENADNLWEKVRNGGKWAFGKIIISLHLAQPDFARRLQQKALGDSILGGTVLEFCSRYQSLVCALEKHDREHIFLNIIETGVFGKVFSILAQPADSIRQNRDLAMTHQQMTSEDFDTEPELKIKTKSPERPLVSEYEEKSGSPLSETARRLFVNTFTRKKKEEPSETKESADPDPFSLALEKSFGSSDPIEKTEPVFESSEPEIEEPLAPVREIFISPAADENDMSMPEITLSKDEEPSGLSLVSSSLEENFLSSREKLADIRREWEDAKTRNEKASESASAPKAGSDEDYSYPFGGWSDVENYNK